MNRNRIYILITIIVVLAVGAAILLLRPDRLAVGFQPGAVNYPMMYAIEEGFFQREGLDPDVQIFRSANDAQDALLGNAIFLDAVIPIQNIAAIEAHQPGSFGIMALLISDRDHPLDFLVVPKDSKIMSARDLSGKTIVVYPGTYSETVTRLALKQIGVEKVTFLKLPPSEMPQAIRSGQADAGIVYEPVATLAELQGWGRILERGFWENNLLPEIVVGAYAFNAPAGREDPDLTLSTYNALKAAILETRKNPDDAKIPLQKYLGVEESILPLLPSSRVELADEVDYELVRKTLELYADHGIIPSLVDLRSNFYDE
jgi:NitT/TauT family transport system substrate-binding protein